MARWQASISNRASTVNARGGGKRKKFNTSIFLICGLVITATSASAQVDTGWVRRWSGVGALDDGITAIGTDRWGNIYAAGYSTGEMTGSDILLLKYTPDGTLSWSQRYDWQGLNDYTTDALVDLNGNVFICGYSYDSLSSADFITLRYDSDGNLQWVTRFNGPGNSWDGATAIARDSSGNIYVTGYCYSSSTYDDFCTIKYSPAGEQLWVQRYSGANVERAYALACDLSGNVYVTGYTQAGNDYLTVKYNTNGVQQWVDRYNGDGNGQDYATAICTDRLGNCYVTGYSWGTGTADYDYVTIKYTSTGTREWVDRYNGDGNDNDNAYAVVADPDGDFVYVTGGSIGVNSFYDLTTIKYNRLGQQLWVRRYDTGNNYEIGRRAVVDNRGNVYIGGYLVRGSNYDFLVVSYNANGELRWNATYNGPGNGYDYLNALKLDPWDNVLAGGVSNGGSNTRYDCVLIKYIQPDVAARRVIFPVGTIDTASTVTPRAMVANLGSARTDFKAFFAICRSGGVQLYLDSVTVTGLGTGDSTEVTFSEWTKPHLLGSYEARCSTYRAYDQNPGNDVARSEFQVTSGPYGWQEMLSVPPSPSGRQVKDGGSLVYCEVDNRIYVIKGNRSGDFYYYQPNLRSWVTLPLIPSGPSGKQPGKGAKLACDMQENVYLVRGNNTREFWRFHSDSGWVQLEDIPAGGSGKAVKGGSDVVYVEDGFLYLLKGYKNEFYRFRISTGTWEELEPAPPLNKPKWDKGSFIVYDNAGSIYACRGKYHDLWRYDIGANRWDTLNLLKGMPFLSKTGRSSKLKDGGCGAYFNGSIYALKGGNTCEFWRYDISGDSWVEIEPIPEQGSTGRKKRVKAGADIVYGGDAFYALKGNKTVEFWRYAISPESQVPSLVPKPGNDKRINGDFTSGFYSTESNSAVFQVQGFSEGRAEVAFYDPSGRLKGRGWCLLRAGRAEVGLNGLNPGVYFVRIEQGGSRAKAKLIISR